MARRTSNPRHSAHAAAPPSPPPARARRGTAGGWITGGVAAAGTLAGIERDSLDARYDVRGTHATPDVVVVGIDEDTAARFGFPFARRLHARATETLLEAGARTCSSTTSSSQIRVTQRTIERCCARSATHASCRGRRRSIGTGPLRSSVRAGSRARGCRSARSSCRSTTTACGGAWRPASKGSPRCRCWPREATCAPASIRSTSPGRPGPCAR